LSEKDGCRAPSVGGDEDLEKEIGGEVWVPGARFKIEEKNGQLWTATILRVEGNLIYFTDKNGQTCGVDKDNIKSFRKLGDAHVD
jgi:hypothetical protein